jgi:HSP20 family molecular chaperone IbpA
MSVTTTPTTTTTDLQTDSAAQPAQPAQAADSEPGRAITPRVDVSEDDTGITLLADLPGVAREQLALHVEADTLHIEGTVGAATPGGLEPVYAEVRLPRYRRAFTLSRELDASRIEAQLKDGVLRLRIPKQAHAQPRRIEVQAG